MHGRDISLLSNPKAQYEQLQFVLEFTMNEAQVTGVDSYIKELERFGISFANTSTEDAKEFLTTNTYYQKLRSYLGRTPEEREFDGLDFKDLVELSRIDFSLSRQVLTLALAIEHALKIQIWQLAESEGKGFLKKCLDSLDEKRTEEEKFSGRKVQTSDYSRTYLDAPSTHNTDSPKISDCELWELLESLSFGDIIQLYSAAVKVGKCTKPIQYHFLKRIQELRNAASHENCLLARTPKTGDEKRNFSKQCDIYCFSRSCFSDSNDSCLSAEKKQKELSRLFLHDFCILLYVHRSIVTSSGMQKHAVDELSDLSERIKKGQENFKTRSCQFMSEVNATLTGIQNAIEQFISSVQNTTR